MLIKLFIINIVIFVFFAVIEMVLKENKASKKALDNLNFIHGLNIIAFFILLILIIFNW